MFSVLWVFLQSAAFHIWYAALHLETGSFPRPLRPAEERQAFAEMQAGNRAARDRLINHNLRLVAHVAKKYYAAAGSQEDLVSIGTIGLIKAVDSFDPARRVRFASFASQCIENAILPQTPVWKFRLEQRNGFASLCQNGKSLPGSRRISIYSAAPTTASPASRPWPCTGSGLSCPVTCWRLRQYHSYEKIGNVPDRLRWCRLRLSLLQREVAAQVGIATPLYIDLETGASEHAPAAVTHRLAELYGVSVTNLLDEYNRFLYKGQARQILALRQQAGPSRAAFACKNGISESSLRAWETETKTISKKCWEWYFQDQD